MARTIEYTPNFKRPSIRNTTTRSTNPRMFPQAIRASGDFPSKTRQGGNSSETFPPKKQLVEKQKSFTTVNDINSLARPTSILTNNIVEAQLKVDRSSRLRRKMIIDPVLASRLTPIDQTVQTKKTFTVDHVNSAKLLGVETTLILIQTPPIQMTTTKGLRVRLLGVLREIMTMTTTMRMAVRILASLPELQPKGLSSAEESRKYHPKS